MLTQVKRQMFRIWNLKDTTMSIETRRKPLRSIELHSLKNPHAGLWLDKFIKRQDKQEKTVRSQFVNDVTGIKTPDSYQAFFKLWQKYLDNYRKGDCVVKCRNAKAQGR